MRFGLRMACFAVALLAAGGARADDWKDESGHGCGDRREWRRDHDRDRDRREWRERAERGRLRWDGPEGLPPPWVMAPAPPGHMPPPGECRVWWPDRPPGQQPPPFRC